MTTFSYRDYSTYINSSRWRATRRRFIAAGYAERCWGCGKPWGKGDHIHHQTYKRLGAELMADLVPLCEPCHDRVHELFERPEIKRKGLRHATHLVVRPEYVKSVVEPSPVASPPRKSAAQTKSKKKIDKQRRREEHERQHAAKHGGTQFERFQRKQMRAGRSQV